MARVEVPVPGDLVVDGAGNVLTGRAVTLKLAGTATVATHYSALTGGTSTTGGLVTHTDGTVVDGSGNRRYVAAGAPLDLTIAGRTRQIEPVSADENNTGTVNPAAYAGSVANAITAAGILGKHVVIDTTYTMSSTLTLPDNVVLDFRPGGILDFSGMATSSIFITAAGTEATAVNLTANTTAGGSTVTATGHGLVAGDWFKVGSTTTYDPGRTNQPIGEIAQVLSVLGDVITTRSPLAGGPYTTAATGTCAKLTLRKGVGVRGQGIIRGGGSGSQHVAFRTDKAIAPRVSDVRFENCEDVAISFYDTLDPRVHAVHVNGSNYSSRGYAVQFAWCCQGGSVTASHFRDCRHAVTLGGGASRKGLVRSVAFSFNSVYDSASTGDAVDTHAAAEDFICIGNHIYDSSSNGINIECAKATVIGNHIYRPTAYGIQFHNETAAPTEYTCIGNRVISPTDIGIRYTNGATVGAGSTVKSVTIDGNTVIDGASNGIYCVSTDTWRLKNVKINNNTVYAAAGTAAIQLQKADGCTVTGNTVSDASVTTQSAIRLSDVTGSTINSNATSFLAVGSARGINATSVSGCTMNGNTVSTANVGILVDDASSNCTIQGNIPTSCTVTIQPGTGTGHIISGNATVAASQTLATNAIFTLTPFTSPEQTFHTGTLTANRVVTLSTTRVYTGCKFKITRTGGGAFTLDVGTGPLKSLATNTWAEFVYDGAAWGLTSYGAL